MKNKKSQEELRLSVGPGGPWLILETFLSLVM